LGTELERVDDVVRASKDRQTDAEEEWRS
jgi:hypothetical protein